MPCRSHVSWVASLVVGREARPGVRLRFLGRGLRVGVRRRLGWLIGALALSVCLCLRRRLVLTLRSIGSRLVGYSCEGFIQMLFL